MNTISGNWINEGSPWELSIPLEALVLGAGGDGAVLSSTQERESPEQSEIRAKFTDLGIKYNDTSKKLFDYDFGG